MDHAGDAAPERLWSDQVFVAQDILRVYRQQMEEAMMRKMMNDFGLGDLWRDA